MINTITKTVRTGRAAIKMYDDCSFVYMYYICSKRNEVEIDMISDNDHEDVSTLFDFGRQYHNHYTFILTGHNSHCFTVLDIEIYESLKHVYAEEIIIDGESLSIICLHCETEHVEHLAKYLLQYRDNYQNGAILLLIYKKIFVSRLDVAHVVSSNQNIIACDEDIEMDRAIKVKLFYENRLK